MLSGSLPGVARAVRGGDRGRPRGAARAARRATRSTRSARRSAGSASPRRRSPASSRRSPSPRPSAASRTSGAPTPTSLRLSHAAQLERAIAVGRAGIARAEALGYDEGAAMLRCVHGAALRDAGEWAGGRSAGGRGVAAPPVERLRRVGASAGAGDDRRASRRFRVGARAARRGPRAVVVGRRRVPGRSQTRCAVELGARARAARRAARGWSTRPGVRSPAATGRTTCSGCVALGPARRSGRSVPDGRPRRRAGAGTWRWIARSRMIERSRASCADLARRGRRSRRAASAHGPALRGRVRRAPGAGTTPRSWAGGAGRGPSCRSPTRWRTRAGAKPRPTSPAATRRGDGKRCARPSRSRTALGCRRR